MELRKVSVEDIFPDEKNPRKEFGDIDALAASFELNEMNPGEPINPPVVVQDGGIYRIIDGERRYRAIKQNKIAQCNVVVCDDISEANSMIAMLATDDKVQLSDIEKSRGVQQMLLLGVDPAKIEKTARLKAGDAMRINKAMTKIDDAAEDMTLDRLYAIAEFADDPEAVKELSNCSEKDWGWKASSIRSKIKQKENTKVAKAICAELNIPFYDEDSDISYRGYDHNGSYCTGDSFDKEGFHARLAELIEASEIVVVQSCGYWTYIRVKRAEEAPAPDPEEEARRIRQDQTRQLAEADRKRRAVWIADNIHQAPSVKAVLEELIETEQACDLEYFHPGSFNTLFGTEVKVNVNAYSFALMEDILPVLYGTGWSRATESPNRHDEEEVHYFQTAVLLFFTDGYELSATERAFYDAFKEAPLTNQEEEADDDSQN